jgi:hypothetical protein
MSLFFAKEDRHGRSVKPLLFGGLLSETLKTASTKLIKVLL